MAELPEKLARLLAEFEGPHDRGRQATLLIELADRFQSVPPAIAARPFPEENHVQGCESDTYVWAEDQPDGTLRFHFAVENPQAISARALSTILNETLSGISPEQIVSIPADIVFRFFGREISLGKGQDLIGIMFMVQMAARHRLCSRMSDA